MTAEQVGQVLHGPFAEYAKQAGLSMRGESYKGGFMFYSMETKKAFEHYLSGFADGMAVHIDSGSITSEN